MTDQQPTAEQLERLARLRQRRAPSDPAPSTPSGNATGGRLAAAGIGVGALVGLVGFLGFDASTSGPSIVDPVAVVAPSPPPDIAPAPAPAPIRIVIHRVPATTVALPVTQVPVTGALDTAPGPPAPSTTAAPVELIATPIVETITVAAPAPAPAPQRPQPAATTTSSGS